MSSLQIVSVIGIPITVLLVAVALIAFARPDADDGPYAAYLALASLFSLYMLLLMLGALGESIGQHLVLGSDQAPEFDSPGALSTYYSLFTNGGAIAIAAFATVAAVMGGSFVFHSRRRAEFLTDSAENESIGRIDRAYRAGVCFAMLALAAVAALVAGAAGYTFFSEPIAAALADQNRDLAMGSLLAYGGLVLVAGLIFRAHFWAIRGNDETPEPEVTVTEFGDA
jgi:hypothetical protein